MALLQPHSFVFSCFSRINADQILKEWGDLETRLLALHPILEMRLLHAVQ